MSVWVLLYERSVFHLHSSFHMYVCICAVYVSACLCVSTWGWACRSQRSPSGDDFCYCSSSCYLRQGFKTSQHPPIGQADWPASSGIHLSLLSHPMLRVQTFTTTHDVYTHVLEIQAQALVRVGQALYHLSHRPALLSLLKGTFLCYSRCWDQKKRK